MSQQAHQLYQGADWCTYRYSAAQVYDLLDHLREAAAALFSGEAPPVPEWTQPFAPMPMLQDLCSDIEGAVDLALADLSVTLQQHLPSRWLMVEMRVLAGQLPDIVRHCLNDQDNLPDLADRAERIRHLLQRLDA